MSSERYKVGELRPSQIMFSFGIGAVVDLPNLSVMVMGLNEWDTVQSDPLAEERLLAAVRQELGPQVQKLTPPPVPPDNQDNSSNVFGYAAKVGIPVSPFPGWGVCPACRLLAPFSSSIFTLKDNAYRPDKTRYIHGNCTKSGKYPPTVIPARFLVACSQGHLDDFPWLYFVHRGETGCPGSLRLLEAGISGSAADVIVKCDRCGQPPRSLSEAFGGLGQQNMPQCRGRHPHLRRFADDGCAEQMKSILLGASNSWFPVTLSVLSIPSTSNTLGQLVETNWATFQELSDESQVDLLRRIGQLKAFSQYSDADLWKEIQRQKSPDSKEENDVRNLKLPEWEVFSAANPDLNTPNFRLRPEAPPTGYAAYFSKTVLVERLREVRALIGFTRIESPGDLSDIGDINEVSLAPLSRDQPKDRGLNKRVNMSDNEETQLFRLKR